MKENEPLAFHTTLQVGGEAEYFAEVHSEDELVESVTFAREKGLPIKILGGGSNVLVPDEGVSGLVIKNQIKGITHSVDGDAVTLTAAAGENFDELVALCVENSWWGIENLSHIPGTVGATPVQNVGAYGVEVKDIIESVRVYDTGTGSFSDFSNIDCTFDYRDSAFKRESNQNLVVVSVTFSLSVKPQPMLAYKDLQNFFPTGEASLSAIREAIISIRSKKFPDWHAVGTAGSFFKNPIISTHHYNLLKEKFEHIPGFAVDEDRVKVPLGWVLDKILNLKGKQTGNVGTYSGQALVLVNHGGATARDIFKFASAITEQVKKETDIDVEWEVTRW